MKFEGRGSTRQSKFDAAATLIAGVGIVLAIIGGVTSGPLVGAGIFVISWIVSLVVIMGRSAANLLTDDGVPHEESKFSATVTPLEGPDSADEKPDFAERLRDLEDLKRDGLISQDEYRAKREEILAEKW